MLTRALSSQSMLKQQQTLIGQPPEEYYTDRERNSFNHVLYPIALPGSHRLVRDEQQLILNACNFETGHAQTIKPVIQHAADADAREQIQCRERNDEPRQRP